MSVNGVVRNGKVEFEDGTQLPEGAQVRVELTAQEWIKQWDELVKQVSEASRGQPSAVDLLSEMRR